MFWRRKRSTIHVEFIDAATLKLFAQTDISPEHLPESFEAETTMHLGQQDWRVLSADPANAAGFRASGHLRLVMSRVEIATVDPRDILFSLPTIAEALPPSDAATPKAGKRVLELHEDDWRQVEFFSAEAEARVGTHLAQVREVHETARRGVGFVRLHLREGLGELLTEPGCTLSALRARCPADAEWLDGIALRGDAGLVVGGFAVALPTSVILYGTASGDGIRVLGIHSVAGMSLGPPQLEPVLAFVRSNELRLVDWCRATRLDPAL